MRDVRRTAFASARWERQTGVRGVPSTKASAVSKVINAESYEPSAERSLRISRCKARMRENGKRREDNQLADAEARLKCASWTETPRRTLS